jgi:hypothetical protein
VIAQAASQGVKINALVVGSDSSQLAAAVSATKGLYISGGGSTLQAFFTDEFFPRFNSNLRWIVLWLGAAWISLMWLLALPLDRWILQGLIGEHVTLSERKIKPPKHVLCRRFGHLRPLTDSSSEPLRSKALFHKGYGFLGTTLA